MFATLLRSAIMCVSSLIPENSPLDSVVFRSSVQILLSVFYFLLFTTVSIVIRVLMSRRALDDPNSIDVVHTDVVHTDVEHKPERDDERGEVHLDNSDYDDSIMSYAPSSELRPGLSVNSITGNMTRPIRGTSKSVRRGVRRGGIDVLSRMGRGVGRKVRQMASVVVVGSENNVEGRVRVPDHEPSVDDPSSEMSDATSVDEKDTGAGVQHVKVRHDVAQATRGLKQNAAVSYDMRGDQRPHESRAASSRILQDGPFADPSTLKGLPSDHKMTLSSALSHPSSAPNVVQREDDGLPVYPPHQYASQASPFSFAENETCILVHEPSQFGMDDIYTDVYGLGFAAYILHYTIDCASIQPTGFLLIGLTLLSGRDVAEISESVRLDDESIPQTTLFTRALTIFAFILLSTAQICMIVGIVHVPTYYTDTRDGGIIMIPAPQSILEHLLARVFPLCTPLCLYFIARKRSRRPKAVASISKVFRRAMPITVCIALWFITCFGVMSDRIRNAVGALSVNATVTELSETDVTINMHLSMVFFSPFVKIPALISVISCCLSRKTMDVTSTLAMVFYAKQLHAVRDVAMLQMLSVAFMCSSVAWACCILRYCNPLVRTVASFFERYNGKYTIED
jgi:hypothetical protein